MPSSKQLILILLTGLLTTLPLQSGAKDVAPIMPLAAKSLLLDIDIAGDRLVVAGERGHILYSDDLGKNWVQAEVPTTQMLTAVHFADDQHGWAVGHDGLILATDDAGKTWHLQRDGLAAQREANLALRDAALQQIRLLEKQLKASHLQGVDELELQLDDARFDLEDANIALDEDVFTSPLMDIWFQDRKRGWAVGAFGTLLETVDGGQHWTDIAQQIDNPGELHLNSVTGDARGRVYIAGEGGALYRSDNSGESWGNLPHLYDGSWFGILYVPREQVVLVFGLQGNLYRSEDFGDNFTVVPNDSHITLAGGSVAESGAIVIAGGVGAVLKSNDAGKSFQTLTLRDRLSLSSGLEHKGKLFLAGQGGIKIADEEQ